MKNLTRLEIKDLINRYQSELRKLEYQIQRTKRTIEELEEVVGEKDISSDLEVSESPTKEQGKRATTKSKTKKTTKAKKKGKSPGRPPKHVIPGRETETRHGVRLSAWDQMIFDVIEDAGEVLKTKSIIEGVAKEASRHDIDATKKYIRQKVSQSIHKLANKHQILSKVDAKGRGYAYAPKEWTDSKGNLKSQYKGKETKSTGKAKKTSKKKKSSVQKKSTGRRGRPPKYKAPKDIETETRGGYKLSAWDQMIFDVIEDAGEALKTKYIIEGAKQWASEHDVDTSQKYLRQKVAASIHKLANKHKTLKKVDAEGRGYAYAPKEWVHSNGKLKAKYKGDKMKSTSASKSTASSSKKENKKTSGRRGRPPKYKATDAGEPSTRGGYKLSAWDQMIFEVIEDAGNALKTKEILKRAKKWTSDNSIDADDKYIRQKVAASIHKLSNKHNTLKKVDAEGRGYAYAPKEWINSQGKLMKKYRSGKVKSSSGSSKKSSGKKSSKKKESEGYRLSDWDEMVIQSIEKAGQALKNKEIFDFAEDWAKKEGKKTDEKGIKQKISQSLHKLANKRNRLIKVDAEGRGYAYAPSKWTSNGKLKSKYQRS